MWCSALSACVNSMLQPAWHYQKSSRYFSKKFSFDDRHSSEAEFALPQVPNLEIEKKEDEGGLMTRMGPIEKVAKWRETQTDDAVAHVAGVNSNLPSCYGSCPTRWPFLIQFRDDFLSKSIKNTLFQKYFWNFSP